MASLIWRRSAIGCLALFGGTVILPNPGFVIVSYSAFRLLGGEGGCVVTIMPEDPLLGETSSNDD